MTDAHCHVSCGDPAVRELLVGRDFFGIHPWQTLQNQTIQTIKQSNNFLLSIRSSLLENPKAGVGEIGLDRLKVRDIPPIMREVFIAQLKLAFELHRPVVLHGAKCWGQVVDTIKNLEFRIKNDAPPLLFHGFSRSDGLIPDIVKLNGFISVGPAVLNDHAVNYRELVKKIPLDRLLIETDRDTTTDSRQPMAGNQTIKQSKQSNNNIQDILAKTAELRGISPAELEKITDENAEKFMGASL